MPSKKPRSPRRNETTRYQLVILCLLVVMLLAVYSWSTGELGLGDKPDTLFKDDNLNFLTAVIGGFTLAGAIFALHLNQTQLKATLEEFRESNYLTHYAELDRIYFDLLKLAVEHPHLRSPDSIETPAQRQQYDAYAYMVWNFIETVIDRVEMEKAIAQRHAAAACVAPATPQAPDAGSAATLATTAMHEAIAVADAGNPGQGIPDAGCGLNLQETWQAAIRAEIGIHGGWLTKENASRFKRGFDALVKHYR